MASSVRCPREPGIAAGAGGRIRGRGFVGLTRLSNYAGAVCRCAAQSTEMRPAYDFVTVWQHCVEDDNGNCQAG